MGPGEPNILEQAHAEQEPPSFIPLRPASRRARAALFVIGPLLWLGAIVAVAFSVRRGSAVLLALAIVGGTALLALVVLLPMRAARVRAEKKR